MTNFLHQNYFVWILFSEVLIFYQLNHLQGFILTNINQHSFPFVFIPFPDIIMNLFLPKTMHSFIILIKLDNLNFE